MAQQQQLANLFDNSSSNPIIAVINNVIRAIVIIKAQFFIIYHE